MCKSYIEGYKRCDTSVESKARESIRKAISYQAKKAGISVDSWKESNPEQLQLLNDSYDTKLSQFEKESSACNETHDGNMNKKVGVTTFQKILNRLKNRKSNHGFAFKGERRVDNSPISNSLYQKLSQEYLQELALSDQEKKSVYKYTDNLYSPINQYLTKQRKVTLAEESAIQEHVKNLDSVLRHRNEQERIVYRGMPLNPSNKMFRESNNGERLYDVKKRKDILAKTYSQGTELLFDGFSSASDQVFVASDWCGVGNRGIDSKNIQNSDTGILFEIKTSAGVPIAHISNYSEEREVLLPRGMRFKIVNSYWNSNNKKDCYKHKDTRNQNVDARNPNILVVQIVEVDDQGNPFTGTEDYIAPPMKDLNRK